ncbi:adenylate kinase [Halobacteriales archaeon QH_10_67_13]|nr:MAG: adenylate kinase [Halobacteriales archaeon QH_10_67_13]
MRVAVTGTPGVGKTTAVEPLETDLAVVHLNDLIREADLAAGRDSERDSLVVDDDAVANRLAGREDVLFESHLAHRYDADRVIVLRCHPDRLTERLAERGMAADSIVENAESEALDLVLSAAVERHGREAVYEIDTTERSPVETAAAIGAAIDGQRAPSAGAVSFAEYLEP